MTDRLAAAVCELVEALRDEMRAEGHAPAADRLLTIPEVCETLGGLSRSALYAGPIASGDLRVIHVGRRTFVPAEAVAAFIARSAE